MKQTILASLLAISLVGCATSKHTVTSTNPAGVQTIDSTVTKQSDNGAVAVITSVVGFTRDTVNLLLPPFIPLITKSITGAVVGDSAPTTNATP